MTNPANVRGHRTSAYISPHTYLRHAARDPGARQAEGEAMEPIIRSGDQLVIVRDDLDQLLGAIARRGFRLIGPTVRDGAIVYDDISSSADLPAGWTDEQDGGTYRLRRRDDDALFGYAVGPQSWKRYLFPSTSTVWRSAEGPATDDATAGAPGKNAGAGAPMAFIGMRSCELRAIAIQ